MKKIIKVLCITVLLQSFAGCEKYNEKTEDIMEGRKMNISGWNYAVTYLPLLRNLSCQPARITTDEEEWSDEKYRLKSDITGRWKLLLDFSTGDTIDYSCKSVIYTFDADGTVMIESNAKEIPGGQFVYDFSMDPFYPYGPAIDIFSAIPNLLIGENKFFCQVIQPWFTIFAVNYVDSERGCRGKTERIFCKID
jgi:hypothetical protein